tara:strand:- start:4843 stop:5730 length:888 start_codon:yes stop_codon:yes gene_type:complete
MKILVIGKNGQIGRYLQKSLDSINNEILFSGSADLDVSKKDDVLCLFNSFSPEIVINASAYTNVERSESDPRSAYLINTTGVDNLVFACEKFGTSLIHISTDYVFDGKGKIPYSTSCPPNPKNIYGKSKLAGENKIVQSNINYYILRTSWVFSEFNINFVKTMLDKGLDGSSLRIVSDQVGNPTFAGDIADAICLMLPRLQEKRCRELYHYCGAPHCSWYEFANEIFEIATDKFILNRKPEITKIKTVDYKSVVERPLFTSLDCSKFETVFGGKMPQWKSSLGKLLDRIGPLRGK